MPDRPKRSPNQQLYFLTFLHTVIDSYATLLPHLLPVLLTRLAAQTTAKYSLAGALISVYNFFSALNQIFFGWLEDRVRSIHFLTFGVACTAFCLSLLNAAPSIRAVFLLLIAGGTGRWGLSKLPAWQSRVEVWGFQSFSLEVTWEELPVPSLSCCFWYVTAGTGWCGA